MSCYTFNNNYHFILFLNVGHAFNVLSSSKDTQTKHSIIMIRVNVYSVHLLDGMLLCRDVGNTKLQRDQTSKLSVLNWMKYLSPHQKMNIISINDRCVDTY